MALAAIAHGSKIPARSIPRGGPALRSIRQLAVAAAASFVLAGAAFAAVSDSATVFVQKSAVDAIAILSNRALPDADRRLQFRTILLKNFDAPAIGRFVVGPFWANAKPDQQARFQAVFEGALANIYTERFFEYDGQSLAIKGTHPGDPGVTVVQTTVATPTGDKSYDVDWMVTGAPGKEKFLDVVIDGISTSLLTQQDYASVLGSAKGNLDALTSALKAKGL
jgi:phospholipid transport system substrate-binding protein